METGVCRGRDHEGSLEKTSPRRGDQALGSLGRTEQSSSVAGVESRERPGWVRVKHERALGEQGLLGHRDRFGTLK